MIPRVPRTLLALLLVAIALIPAGAASAQETRAESSLSALVAPLYQQLAALKGMAAPGPPSPILIESRGGTGRFIRQELDRRYPVARVEADRKGMVASGLIAPGYD